MPKRISYHLQLADPLVPHLLEVASVQMKLYRCSNYPSPWLQLVGRIDV